jgi:hypothetical protein
MWKGFLAHLNANLGLGPQQFLQMFELLCYSATLGAELCPYGLLLLVLLLLLLLLLLLQWILASSHVDVSDSVVQHSD